MAKMSRARGEGEEDAEETAIQERRYIFALHAKHCVVLKRLVGVVFMSLCYVFPDVFRQVSR